jgi:hypothetical protein
VGGDSALLVAAAWLTVFSGVSAVLADHKQRSPAFWAVCGAIIGPAAVAILAMAPPGRCPVCDAAVHGWPTQCEACGAGLRTRASSKVAKVPSAAMAMPIAPARSTAEPPTVPTPPMDQTPAGAAAIVPPDMAPMTDKPATTSKRRARRSQADAAGADAGTAPTAPAGAGPAGAGQAATAPAGAGPARVRVSEPARASDPPSAIPIAAEPVASSTGLSDRIIATGVFVGGSQSLEIGRRYMLAIHGDALEIRGPVDMDPNRVAVSRRLASVEASGLGDRLLISGAGRAAGMDALGFTSITGETAEAVERSINDRGLVGGAIASDG